MREGAARSTTEPPVLVRGGNAEAPRPPPGTGHGHYAPPPRYRRSGRHGRARLRKDRQSGEAGTSFPDRTTRGKGQLALRNWTTGAPSPWGLAASSRTARGSPNRKPWAQSTV